MTSKNASRIASYTLNLPKDVSRQALKEARLKMAVKANGEIELTAIVGGEEHKSTVEKQEPEFVDEIHRTESAVGTGSVQAFKYTSAKSRRGSSEKHKSRYQKWRGFTEMATPLILMMSEPQHRVRRSF